MLLAKHGVLDALTKVLAKIQELQPENPLEVKLHRNIRMMTSLTLIFSHSSFIQISLFHSPNKTPFATSKAS